MAISENKRLKSIAFDLNTKALKEHYTKGDWHNAYNDIKMFLKENSFVWKQGSVYDSTKKLSQTEFSNLIDDIYNQFEWFSKSIRSIRGYDQPKVTEYTKKQERDKQIINKSQNPYKYKASQAEIEAIKAQTKEALKRIQSKNNNKDNNRDIER